MCAHAHAEVAERRVARAEREILERVKKAKPPPSVRADFLASQKKWREFRDQYCKFTNAIDEYPDVSEAGSHLHAGFCDRRLTEQRADELELILLRERE